MNNIKARGILGHHKCGTHWVDTVFNQVAKFAKLRYVRQYDTKFGSLKQKLRGNPSLFALLNIQYSILNEYKPNEMRAIYVVRDPRDVLVSAYFSHKYSHKIGGPWTALTTQHNYLQEVSESEGLMSEFSFHCNQRTFMEMRNWPLEDPRIKVFRLEDLSDNPEMLLCDALEFLELFTGHIQRENFVKQILAYAAYEKMSGGRKKGEEDINHHYRKGVHGDWRNHLEPCHIERMREWTDVLLKYGYETKEDWV